ncbi:hypothetical protein F3J40_19985 [Pantoea sp. Acro-835]|uniref:Uncharacterized protein n=1 Tax=Candidatus Pantoea multigeneris TaxID=2608357 RepID=A0ABX0RET6_9GAMM|nr:hypothetical protein [Pantoea multigeneris]
MMNYVIRFFKRLFKSYFSIYGPALLTIVFAVTLFQILPNSPLWPVPLFFVIVIVLFYRYVKW